MTNWGTAKLSTLCRRIGDGLHGTPSYVDNGNIYFINGNNLRSGKIIIDFDKLILLIFHQNIIQRSKRNGKRNKKFYPLGRNTQHIERTECQSYGMPDGKGGN